MKKYSAFTVLELLVVLSIIIILLSLVLANLGDIRRQSRDKSRVADIHTIRLALEGYFAICNSYPSKLEIDDSNCIKDNNITKFGEILPNIPADPSSEDSYKYSVADNSYNYHIGAVLEKRDNSAFDEDHDFDKDNNFDSNDFDGRNDALKMIYDFRRFKTN